MDKKAQPHTSSSTMKIHAIAAMVAHGVAVISLCLL
jgi:hypothetical protein